MKLSITRPFRATALASLMPLALAAACSSPATTADDENVGTTKEALSAAQYFFVVDAVNITNTRAWHNDTDLVSAAVDVDGAVTKSRTMDIGDLNNGYHSAFVPVPGVWVGPSSKVKFDFSVVNSGYRADSAQNAQTVVTDVGKVTVALSGASGPLLPFVDGALSSVLGWLFANCDGAVAADSIAFDAATLDQLTAATGAYSEWRHYDGTSSPSGCGSNSQYDVHWSVMRWDPAQSFEMFKGTDSRATLATGDWKPYAWKAECAPGMAVKGISRATSFSASHEALCRTGATSPASYPHNSCHVLDFSTSDARWTTSTGDWDYGNFKGECGANEYVAGVSQSQDYKVNSILCCPGATPHRSCAAMKMDGHDAREWTGTGDWDYGYWKAECGNARYAAGVSRNPSTGAPHALLCCGF